MSMRIAFVLPGLHRVVRGAEVAFESIARELTLTHGCSVTLFGSGYARQDDSYDFIHVSNLDRKSFEGWPQFPVFRNEYIYEEFTFTLNLIPKYNFRDFDVTVTCSYPFLNWFLRSVGGNSRPRHVFVTQNSDHPSIENKSEYKLFNCDGLVCTNPQYFERNKDRWNCALITNGVDPEKFSPRDIDRALFNLPSGVPVVLMVSALIPSKRIVEGIEAVAKMPGCHLVVCGDGPERERVREAGETLLRERFHLKKLPHAQMPDIYRVADVLLHLSLDEPFGNIYLEALATGLPIVAHDRDVTRWIVEDVATLVDTTKQDNIIDGLTMSLQSQSPIMRDKRLALVERRFTWSSISQGYYEFFQALHQ